MVDKADSLRGHGSFRDTISPKLQRDLFVYWSGLRKGQTLPSRRDVDPLDIPTLLPYIGLIDVLGGSRFRYRLVGTGINSLVAHDLTASEIMAPGANAHEANLVDLFAQCIERRSAVHSVGELAYPDGLSLNTWHLAMPLAGNGYDVDKLLFSIFPDLNNTSVAWTGNMISASIGFTESMRSSESFGLAA